MGKQTLSGDKSAERLRKLWQGSRGSELHFKNSGLVDECWLLVSVAERISRDWHFICGFLNRPRGATSPPWPRQIPIIGNDALDLWIKDTNVWGTTLLLYYTVENLELLNTGTDPTIAFYKIDMTMFMQRHFYPTQCTIWEINKVLNHIIDWITTNFCRLSPQKEIQRFSARRSLFHLLQINDLETVGLCSFLRIYSSEKELSLATK